MKQLRQDLENHLTFKKFDSQTVSQIMADFDSYVETNPDCSEDACIAHLKAKWFKPSKGMEEPAEAKASINYRQNLMENLKNYKYTTTVLGQIFENFDFLSKRDGINSAYAFCMSEFCPNESKRLLESYAAQLNVTFSSPVAKMIQGELEKASKTLIIKSPIDRVRRAIKNYRASIGKLDNCTLRSSFCPRETDILSPAEKESLANRYQALEMERQSDVKSYEAWGSVKQTLRESLRGGLQFENEI